MPKSIVVRLSKENTYRHLHTLCQNDKLFTIIDYPDGWQDKDYERIVISDAEAIRNGIQRAVVGTIRLLPYDNGTTIMFVDKDAIWHNEISKSGEKLFAQYIERAIEHFTDLNLILHKSAEVKNKGKTKTKVSHLSSPQKKLSNLRDELIEINSPLYPGDPYMRIKHWVAKATPLIRTEWAESFDDFNNIITIGGWTSLDMANFVDIVTYGNAQPNSNENWQAWNDDVKKVEEIRQNILNFLGGLTLLSPKHQKSSPLTSILFLSADPTDASRLRLGKEFREIQEKFKLSKLREQFRLALPQLAARPADISQALLDEEPQIVHFSGHGTSTGALCFENQDGEIQLVQPNALAALFEQFSSQINCVILNACYSEVQAKAISQHIKYVIGMNKAIGDNAAIAFAIGFYQALGAGRTVEQAYKMGCVQIGLHNIPENLTPVLVQKSA